MSEVLLEFVPDHRAALETHAQLQRMFAPPGQGRLLVASGLYWALGVALAVGFAGALADAWREAAFVPALIILLSALGYSWYVLLDYFSRRRTLKWLSAKPPAVSHRLIADGEGITVDSAHALTRAKWAGIEAIERFPGGGLLVRSVDSYFAIPATEFASSEQAAACLSALKRHWREHGGPPADGPDA